LCALAEQRTREKLQQPGLLPPIRAQVEKDLANSTAMVNGIEQLFTQYKILALLIAIAVIWAFFSFKTDGGFISPRNLSNLMRQMAVTGVVAG